MNYSFIYQQLCKSRKSRGLNKNKLKGYFEKHHILPRCLGGSDKRDNLVLLTAKEHFLAHKLLTKIYPNNRKILYALSAFSMNNTYQQRFTGRRFQEAKMAFIEAHTGREVSKETRKKQSKSAKNRPPISEETRQKLIQRNKGWERTEETRKKISKTHKGKTLTLEHREAVSKSMEGKRARGAKKEVYHWFNIETGEEQISIMADFRVNFPSCQPNCIHHLVTGKRNIHKGWIILEEISCL